MEYDVFIGRTAAPIQSIPHVGPIVPLDPAAGKQGRPLLDRGAAIFCRRLPCACYTEWRTRPLHGSFPGYLVPVGFGRHEPAAYNDEQASGFKRGIMRKNIFSNAMLGVGIVVLVAFGGMEVAGLHADPLIPAFSAFLIGATAALDRVSMRRTR